MGRRRIRVLKEILPAAELVGFDQNSERGERVARESGIVVKPDWRLAVARQRPGAVFICTSPLAHAEIRHEIIQAGIHHFSEINLLADGYDEAIQAEQVGSARCFLSSTPLYDREMRYIMAEVKKRGVASYRFHVGQYLPDWHPWESYKNFFVGHKATNGCREIMAIEFPWLLDAFGPLRRFEVMKCKISAMDLDYADTYHVLFEHEQGSVGSVLVDVVCRQAVHSLEIFNESYHLFWEGTPGSIRIREAGDRQPRPITLYDEVSKVAGYADTIIENPYTEEVQDFLKGVADSAHNYVYSYRQDHTTLSLIDAIEGE